MIHFYNCYSVLTSDTLDLILSELSAPLLTYMPAFHPDDYQVYIGILPDSSINEKLLQYTTISESFVLISCFFLLCILLLCLSLYLPFFSSFLSVSLFLLTLFEFFKLYSVHYYFAFLSPFFLLFQACPITNLSSSTFTTT